MEPGLLLPRVRCVENPQIRAKVQQHSNHARMNNACVCTDSARGQETNRFVTFCPVISNNLNGNCNQKPNPDKILNHLSLLGGRGEHVEGTLCTTSNYSRLRNVQLHIQSAQSCSSHQRHPSVYEKKRLIPPARRLQRCQQHSAHGVSIYPDVRAAVLQLPSLSSRTHHGKKKILHLFSSHHFLEQRYKCSPYLKKKKPPGLLEVLLLVPNLWRRLWRATTQEE